MKFLKQLSLYSLVGIIGAGINFFMMPVLSHHLSPMDYGLLSLLNNYVILLVPFVGLLANALLSVEYFKEKDINVFRSKFASIQVLPLFTSAVFCLLVFLFYDKAKGLLEINQTSRIWGFIIVLLCVCTIYIELYLAQLINEKKLLHFSIATITRIVIEVSLTLYFVVYSSYGWEGRMYSWIVTSLIYLIVSIYYFHRKGYLKGTLRFRYLREGIIFGLPLILHTVGKFVVNQSDRIFIAKMISIDEAGIYNVGYTVGLMIMIVINAFFNYYTPFLMERLSTMDESKKLEIVRMNYVFIGGTLAILLFITLATPIFFELLIDPRYAGGAKYVFWIGLGYIFWGCYMLFALYINYYNKNNVLGKLAIVNIITNIIFNYFFISWFGAIGAAYATALSFFIILVVIAFYANRLVQLPWLQFRKVFNLKAQ